MLAIIMILVSLASAMQPTDGACPTGWDSVGPGCYKFTVSSSMQDVMKYPEASSSCNSTGGKLVVFNSKDEMVEVGNSLYVREHMERTHGSDYYLWIGCTDQAVEGTFECEDGTQLALDSDLWSEGGQPTSAGSGGRVNDCAYYYRPYNSLRDCYCEPSQAAAFCLCEVEPLTQNLTTQTPAQTTAQVPTTQTPAQTTSQVSTIQNPAQTTSIVSTTQNAAQTTSIVSTTQNPAQTTSQVSTTQNPAQTTAQVSTTQNAAQTTSIVSNTQTPAQTTSQVSTTQTEAQTTNHVSTPPTPATDTNHVSTPQTPATDTNQEFATTVADEPSHETSTGVTGVTRACQPSKHHLKSSVFSRVKDNEGRNLIGYCLTDHVMETVQMVSLIRCSMMCNGIAGCKSFNYKGGVCELNDESKQSVGSRYFVQSDGCTYYELA
ncbi:probable GPI-anchored adhesin-like protein PGA55 isoform X1 [Strongylocentrotus purpuratus]|uniref:C-type lectin domain-containing protein n=1 Tax=Strongylocentrotus purpuratus TaxID=7668 RepID=A0A7M7PB21_STRPU|nr:probable GPI-anchored adhesin-like protein PGA55 isoform X1 [Strongylocentrotus purpuratus]